MNKPKFIAPEFKPIIKYTIKKESDNKKLQIKNDIKFLYECIISQNRGDEINFITVIKTVGRYGYEVNEDCDLEDKEDKNNV